MSGNQQHVNQVTVTSGHAVIPMQNKANAMPTQAYVKVENHEHDKEHHKHMRQQQEMHMFPYNAHHNRGHQHEAVIHVPDDRGSPNKDDSKQTTDAHRGRKRMAPMGPEIHYAMAKRHERDDGSRTQNIPKQFPESIKGENMEISSEFEAIYDPNLPMTMEYQLIAFKHQKKLQDEHLQQIDAKSKRDQVFHQSMQQDRKSPHSRRQKSNEHHNSIHHEGKLPRQSSGEGSHRSSLTNIASGSAQGHGKPQQHQNGPSVIAHSIKSEPEEIRYPNKMGENGKVVTPVVCASPSVQGQQTAPMRRQNAVVRRPAPRKTEESSWQQQHGFRHATSTAHPHTPPIISYAAPGGVVWNMGNMGNPQVQVERENPKPKHESSEGQRSTESSKKGASGQTSDWPRSNSSFTPVTTHHGNRPPTSSPSHPHTSHPHHHQPQPHREHMANNRGERERERERRGEQRPNFPAHQEHERIREPERENSTHLQSSQHPRQNSSSSTSSTHSTSHPSTSSGASRNQNKDANQAAIMAQQHQMLQMQQLAALQQLQQQQLSPSALATLQRNTGGIQNAAMVEEYMKHLQQQQQQQYEMLQKAAVIQPTAINPQEFLQLQMQMAAQMGMGIDQNTAMALMVQQQAAQAQAQQQAVHQQQQQQQQQHQQVQEAQAQAQAQAVQQALLQAAAVQNSGIPSFMYPVTATGQMQQLGFYDPNAFGKYM